MNTGTQLYHPVQIGDVRTAGNLFLAPLAGFTDKGFREICIREGADLTYSEMVSAEAVARKNGKTELLMGRAPNEQLFAIQLFMPDEQVALRAVDAVMRFDPTIIDLNCGCPVPKVVKTGAGSALHHHPQMVQKIVSALSSQAKVPVTVKIRLGWDAQSINYLQMAEAAIAGGASLITMHARTRAQGYSGTAHWEHLKELKRQVPIPVFGSGDLFTPQDARTMLEETGIDGVMFARGAVGNPFIFSRTRHYLQSGKLLPLPSMAERYARLFEQLDVCIADKGEQVACREMRKQVCAYTKGLPGAAALRADIVHAQTREDYLSILHLDQDHSE
jgi:tRNA-dihydrouridine synthase B